LGTTYLPHVMIKIRQIKNQSPLRLPQHKNRLDIYKTVTLKAYLSHLSSNQRKMLALLIDASTIIDHIF